MLRTLLLSILLLTGALAPVEARQRDGDRVGNERAGRSQLIPLPQIEERVLPRMRGATYLGPELNGSAYRLKFIRNGKVIWVDVDARTGRVLGSTE